MKGSTVKTMVKRGPDGLFWCPCNKYSNVLAISLHTHAKQCRGASTSSSSSRTASPSYVPSSAGGGGGGGGGVSSSTRNNHKRLLSLIDAAAESGESDSELSDNNDIRIKRGDLHDDDDDDDDDDEDEDDEEEEDAQGDKSIETMNGGLNSRVSLKSSCSPPSASSNAHLSYSSSSTTSTILNNLDIPPSLSSSSATTATTAQIFGGSDIFAIEGDDRFNEMYVNDEDDAFGALLATLGGGDDGYSDADLYNISVGSKQEQQQRSTTTTTTTIATFVGDNGLNNKKRKLDDVVLDPPV
ncbi:hypothetical protein BDR26DRAFT_865862 [Obelidium mucronatum]|nr:hypothetical protein BDR26DRAFT_865862 [Obelidium mucronatum]